MVIGTAQWFGQAAGQPSRLERFQDCEAVLLPTLRSFHGGWVKFNSWDAIRDEEYTLPQQPLQQTPTRRSGHATREINTAKRARVDLFSVESQSTASRVAEAEAHRFLLLVLFGCVLSCS